MAETLPALADRLFTSILAPLVLGGVVRPAHPIGARAALALFEAGGAPTDGELAARVEMARIAHARRLAPIDTVDEPSGAEWALGAVIHDLLQAANPSWIRKSAPKRLLDLAGATLRRLPSVGSARDALTRHTWFGRLLEVRRRDAAVSWWTGSRQFHGREPPKRLLAWSDLRRVHIVRAERGLTELLGHGGVAEHASAFESTLTDLLRMTPLTDFATCGRTSPPFGWTPETLALARTAVARTLALRAAALAPTEEVNAALGRATRALLTTKAWRDAATALDFLGHRAMSAAQAQTSWPVSDAADDVAFARAAGAMVARRWLDEPSNALSEAERRRLAPIFDAAGRAEAARELAVLMGGSRASSAG